MKYELLRIENILAMEQGLKTLDDFFLNLYKGELLGVFANNATDKRHFMDLISGNMTFDRGRICYENQPVEFKNYQAVRRQKFAFIQPQSKLVEDLTVASNIFVIRDGFKQQIIHKGIIEHQANQLMKELGVCLKGHMYVHQLTRHEKAVVEIVKAYARGADILVFEDLSRYLTDLEIKWMKGLMIKLRDLGKSMVLVDSYARVMEGHCDRVAVIKSGRNLWTFNQVEFSEGVLNRLYHQELKNGKHMARKTDQSKPVLSFDRVHLSDQLQPLSFVLQKGQLLSIFDREGKAVETIRGILQGAIHTYQGVVKLENKHLKSRNPWQSVKKKIGFISENPAESMIFENLSAIDNLTYAAMNKVGNGWFRRGYDRSVIEDYEHYFSPGTLREQTDRLSTFDRHRLAYLKWHLYNPKVLVCYKPFSSVDMALKETTLELMNDLLDKGIAILILTTNYEEAEGLGDLLNVDPGCSKTSKESPL